MRMMMLVGALAMTLAACDGPREDAGENADAASGAVGSEDTLRSGPAETLGERQDEANQSHEQALEARADALEARAEEQRETAEQQARALEEQAERVRQQAN